VSVNVSGASEPAPNRFVSRSCFLRPTTSHPRLRLYSAGWVEGRPQAAAAGGPFVMWRVSLVVPAPMANPLRPG